MESRGYILWVTFWNDIYSHVIREIFGKGEVEKCWKTSFKV